MRSLLAYNKDRYGGVLLVLVGVGAVVQGTDYHFGTLNRMGAGFIPVVLGVLLAVVGAAIALSAGHAPKDETHAPPEWRGWLCIVGGVVSFVVLGAHGGLVPATFASVFVSAMGDRQNSVRDAALLAAGVTVAGVAIFSYGLRLQMPLITGM